MLTTNKNRKEFSLRPGDSWPSFEKFRSEGAKALKSVGNGIVAVLHTKTGQYRIVEEQDFQQMYGLACDIDRLRGGLRMVKLAVLAVQKHPDKESLNVLAEAVAMLGTLPELPTRDGFDSLLPEGFELDLDDEVILDPDQIERPFESEDNALESSES